MVEHWIIDALKIARGKLQADIVREKDLHRIRQTAVPLWTHAFEQEVRWLRQEELDLQDRLGMDRLQMIEQINQLLRTMETQWRGPFFNLVLRCQTSALFQDNQEPDPDER